MTRSILVRIKARTSPENGTVDWSPQTPQHVEKMVRQGMERTKLDYEIINIEE